jgi:hypothetical protein
MKKAGLLLILLAVISCTAVKRAGFLPEDELFIVRKYVGNFVSGTVTPPAWFGSPHKLLITTTLDSLYGEITAYSKDCDFKPGERLFIRRIYQSSEVFGSWVYRIENDAPVRVSYLVGEFRNGRKVLTQNWY